MREKGFFYHNPEDMQREFQMAQEYFRRYPYATKIRRADWKKMYPNLADAPKHSYLNFDGHIIALATKARHRDADHKIGFGYFGAVKYGMDQNGKLYAIKIEKTNTASQQTEEQVNLDLNRMSVGKISRVNELGQTKYYSALEYLGESMGQRLTYGPPWSLKEKKNIARKIAWQLHQLHTGHLSFTDTPYGHGDIKPDNITVDERGRVHIIDFGFAELASNPIETLAGSADYLPTLDAREYHLALQNNEEEKAESYMQGILQNMRDLGRTGTDVFAAKRTLYQSQSDDQSACLFTEEDYQQLNPDLKNLLKTGNKNSEADFHYAVQQKSSALDVSYGFCKEYLSPDLVSEIQTVDQRQTVCEVMALLDEVSFWEEVDVHEQTAIVQDYERRLLSATSWDQIQSIHHELIEWNSCLHLLKQIKEERFSDQDKALQEWVAQKSHQLYARDYVVNDLKTELKAALTHVQSEEMMSIKIQIAKWTYDIQHPGFIDRFFGGTERLKYKLEQLVTAVGQVPIEEREKVLTKSTHVASKIAQQYCTTLERPSLMVQYKDWIQSAKTSPNHPSDRFRPH